MSAGGCTDRRCTDGVTWCEACNGFGVLAGGGKRKYRVRGGGKNISPHAPKHEACHGMGVTACGCVPLDEVTLAMLAGKVLVEAVT